MTTEEKQKNPFLHIPDGRNVDLGRLSPYGLPNPNSRANSEPDYIPFNARGRDFYGRLAFNTGVCWLGGFAAGGVYGIRDGLKSAANPIFRIKMNSVMNSVSKNGSGLGNALGIIAFVHTTSEWVADQLEIEKVTGLDASTPLFSGLVTGALYKSTKGPRAAALAGAIGMTLSTAYWYGSSFFFDKVLSKGGKF